MTEIADWIDLKKNEGKRILVHCRYGIGRTGTVVLSYLLHSGLSFQSAQKILKKTPAWPSTRPQKRLVDHYISSVKCGNTENWFDEKWTRSVGSFFKRMEAILKWDDEK